jgi:phytoene dehydrogenase-like protein
VPSSISYDAVVVGAGPNGLAAGIRLAQHGLGVLVVEANDVIGGGARSDELTLPGFVHDLCSSIHPLGCGSPFFRTLPLEKYGLHWVHPEAPLAHPLDDRRAIVLERSVTRTAEGLGADKDAYESLMEPLVAGWEPLLNEILQPILHVPRHPLRLGRFVRRALQSAAVVVRSRFSEEPARALFAGLAAHSFLPLERTASAAFGLSLGALGHAIGWPLPCGGAQKLADALAAHLRSLGGEIVTGTRIESLDQLPLARALLLDVTPVQLCLIAEDKLPASYLKRLGRYRYGPGVFKVDYALDGPIPWKSTACARAGTVHVCGGFDEVAASERAVAEGKVPERPFVLLAQTSLVDHSRAPSGKHTAWAYCHVPNGSTFDMTQRIENQIERFAPGFRDRVLARHVMNCSDLEQRNANLVGGDISGGANDLWQLMARPVLSPAPYRTPVPGLYLCSSSTPPGGGVHGMCGFHAAETVLHDCFRTRPG